MFKRILRQKVKEAFLKWQYNVSVRKIAETAFNRVLELNHRHSKARIRTGVYLLQNVLEDYTIQNAFNLVLQAAHFRRFDQNGSDVSPICRRSRSRSKGAHRTMNDTSVMLNNVSSLLSPSNLKKIEKINLYKQNLNSFYNPIADTNQNRVNSTGGRSPERNSSANKSIISQELPVRLKYSKTKSTYALQMQVPTSQKAPYRRNL